MKSLIVNTLGGKDHWVTVPANSTAAQAFADAVLDGETAVYESLSVGGSDVVTEARDVNVMLENTTSNERTYVRFIMPMTKNEGDVHAALNGITINGVLVDKIVIVSMRTVQY